MPKFTISLCLVLFASAANASLCNHMKIRYSDLINETIPSLNTTIETKRNDAVSNIMNLYDRVNVSNALLVDEMRSKFENDTQQFDKLNNGSSASGVPTEFETNLLLNLSSILETAINNTNECTKTELQSLIDYANKINGTASQAFEKFRNATEAAHKCVAKVCQGYSSAFIDRHAAITCLKEVKSEAKRMTDKHVKDISLTLKAAEEMKDPNGRMQTCMVNALFSFRTALKDQIDEMN